MSETDPYQEGRRRAEALADTAPPLTDEEIEELQVLLGDALTPQPADTTEAA